MIIGINGYSGSGKDAIGKIIQDLQPEKKWEIKKFAGKLKQTASILTGFTQESFEDENYKKKYLNQAWWTVCDEGYQPIRIREFLQRLGTDALRNGLHPNVWVNALMADYNRVVDMDTYQYATGAIDSRERTKENNKMSGNDLFNYLENVPFPNWVITDVRFPNEADAIKKEEGILIRVNRLDVGPVNSHESETSLDDWGFDYIIDNDSTLVSLKRKVKEILNEIYELN